MGSLATLKPGDQLLATYRCHGYPIALGTDTKAIMAEIYGRKDGLCGGYGGSMHLCDPGRGFLGTSGHRGPGHPPGHRRRLGARNCAGEGQIVLGFFGDGASKQGAFHESLNLASLWKLPIVYVMENNNYNVATRSEQEDANAAAGEPLSVKAKAYSMPGVTVDGTDPVAVYEAVGAGRPIAPAPATGRPWSSPRSTACRPTATSSPRPACRCTTPSTRRSPCSATARSTTRRCAATPCRGSGRGWSSRARSIRRGRTRSQTRSATRWTRRCSIALDDPYPEPEAAARYDYVYA